MSIIRCGNEHTDKVAAFYDEVTLYLTTHTNYPEWQYKKYPCFDSVKKAVENNTQYAYLNDKNEVIGAFVLNRDPQGDYDAANWSESLDESEALIIHSFATLPQMQRRGIGGQMIKYIIKSAKNTGVKALRLDIVPKNIPAKRLYQKYGFKYVGEYDLKRGFENIPTFCLYELSLTEND